MVTSAVVKAYQENHVLEVEKKGYEKKKFRVKSTSHGKIRVPLSRDKITKTTSSQDPEKTVLDTF